MSRFKHKQQELDATYAKLKEAYDTNEDLILQEEKREDVIEIENSEKSLVMEIDKLQSEKEYKELFSDEYGNGCSICLEPLCKLEPNSIFKGKYGLSRVMFPVKINNCNHMFHYECLRNLEKCPLCREPFDFPGDIDKVSIWSMCRETQTRVNDLIQNNRTTHLKRQRNKERDRFNTKVAREREYLKAQMNAILNINSRVTTQKYPILGGKRNKPRKTRKRGKRR